MATPDRAAAMVAAARRRHDDTRRKATDALRRLDVAGEAISFAAVARAAGISRAWLYRDDALRAEIDRLRRPRSTAIRARPAAEQATTDSLRQQLEAVRTLVAELRAENDRLREAVSRKLGQCNGPASTTTDRESRATSATCRRRETPGDARLLRRPVQINIEHRMWLPPRCSGHRCPRSTGRRRGG